MNNKNKSLFRCLFVITLVVVNYMLINGQPIDCDRTYGYPVYFIRRHLTPYDECAPLSTASPYTNSIEVNVPGLIIDVAAWMLISVFIVAAIDKIGKAKQ